MHLWSAGLDKCNKKVSKPVSKPLRHWREHIKSIVQSVKWKLFDGDEERDSIAQIIMIQHRVQWQPAWAPKGGHYLNCIWKNIKENLSTPS